MQAQPGRRTTPSPTSFGTGFLVDQLERADYVQRVPDPADGRARLVRLTRRGTEATILANRIAAEVESEWAAHLGSRTVGQLRRAFEQLRDITDPYAWPTSAATEVGPHTSCSPGRSVRRWCPSGQAEFAPPRDCVAHRREPRHSQGDRPPGLCPRADGCPEPPAERAVAAENVLTRRSET
ncbi:MarR family winged helix-turn-helix transcriptional regulator [Nocardia sp. CWNU-33]|uniref:MarR family winged helix-turn-helix transcriptional regulator n=1 Tax=Nocardia sp. CWNU-33 TaxID=3392117 RepID=UPI00398E9ECB